MQVEFADFGMVHVSHPAADSGADVVSARDAWGQPTLIGTDVRTDGRLTAVPTSKSHELVDGRTLTPRALKSRLGAERVHLQEISDRRSCQFTDQVVEKLAAGDPDQTVHVTFAAASPSGESRTPVARSRPPLRGHHMPRGPR